MADEQQKGAKQKASAETQGQPQPDQGTYFRYVGDRAIILESGQPLGPGEYVTLTQEQLSGHNQRLVDEGRLIDASDVQPQ